MSKPIVANNTPAEVSLEKEKEYYFCVCGRSKNQPFCDGSHVGTDFKPLVFKAGHDGPAWLCQCKHTCNAPYCDGSHKQFSSEDIDHAGPGTAASVADTVQDKPT